MELIYRLGGGMTCAFHPITDCSSIAYTFSRSMTHVLNCNNTSLYDVWRVEKGKRGEEGREGRSLAEVQ